MVREMWGGMWKGGGAEETLEGSGRRWSDQIRVFEIFLARVLDEPLELGRPLFSQDVN